MNARSLLCCVCITCALPSAALAQETRADTIAVEQAEKATRLAPYKPHPAEAFLVRLRQKVVEQPGGFFPSFDTVYSGGGFTLGAGYRHFTGDQTQWSLAGSYSAKNYKLVQLSAASPGHLSGHLDVQAIGLWRDATQVAYHGLGVDSPAEVDTAFRMQQALVGGGVTVRPRRRVLLTAAASFEDYTIKNPTGGLTSVEDAYTPAQAPGIGVDPSYLHTTTAAAFDSRPAADYARSGALYRIAHHNYIDQDSTYSFNRLDTEIVQHIPILRENWVLSLHGRLEATVGDDDQVPYFLLPALGSGSTLRGYSSWRFHDRDALLLSGDWRWIANRLALDMAIFYDAGMVAPRLEDIALKSFVQDFGVGIRFHGPISTPLRVEVARGSEGVRLVFSAGAAF